MTPARLTTCWIFALLWATPARAGFDLPDHVHSLDRLAGAVERARQQNRPLAFVLTDANTHCGLCRTASLDAFRVLRSSAVLVYVGPDELQRLPLKLRVALTSARAGQFIPKVVVAGATLSEIVAVVPYAPEPRRSALLAQAIDLIRRHEGRDAPRLALNLKLSRQAVRRIRPGTPIPPRAAAAGLARSEANARTPVAPRPNSKPIVVLGWQGELAPAPADIVGGFFQTQQVPMRGRCRAASCRFEATAPVAAEAFQTALQILLNQHYRVDRVRIRGHRVTAWLAPAETAERPAETDRQPSRP